MKGPWFLKSIMNFMGRKKSGGEGKGGEGKGGEGRGEEGRGKKHQEASCKGNCLFVLSYNSYTNMVWWYYLAEQLNSTTTALLLPLLKGTGGENMMERAQGRRQGQKNHSTIIFTGKIDSV